jgi:hypothetical protein
MSRMVFSLSDAIVDVLSARNRYKTPEGACLSSLAGPAARAEPVGRAVQEHNYNHPNHPAYTT